MLALLDIDVLEELFDDFFLNELSVVLHSRSIFPPSLAEAGEWASDNTDKPPLSPLTLR